MEAKPDEQLPVLHDCVDLDRYPLLAPESAGYRAGLARIRADLAADGCSVLRGFLRDEVLERLEREGEAVAPGAYYAEETVNAYNLPLSTPLPEGHPARTTFARGNAFVARDLIPETHIVARLFASDVFRRFIADAFELERLYRLADPLAGLCLNVLQPGRSHPWHFDINEFTVSLLTKKPEAGGVFEFCPDIRSPQAENFDRVAGVLDGTRADLVQRLELRRGDLQLFKGRYALHRVSPVEGGQERHTAIFAYTLEPGVVGTPDRTRQLFGRHLAAHEEAARQKVRADGLLD